MNNEDFEKVVNNRIDSIKQVLTHKAKEYSSDMDRLHNFKVAAQLSIGGISSEEALWGMLRKHLVSVMDIVQRTGLRIYPTAAMRDEKITDAVNYLILLEALLIESSPPDPEPQVVVEGTCGSLIYKNLQNNNGAE